MWPYQILRNTLTTVLLFLIGLVCVVSQQRCEYSQMQRCIDPLKVLTDDRDLSFASTLNELESVCPVLTEAMACLDQFTVSCLPAKQKAAVDMIYEGARNIISQVCSDTRFRAEYLDHAQCMKRFHGEYEGCVHSYSGNTKEVQPTVPTDTAEKLRTVCCAFHNYVRCTTDLFQDKCGDNAANFTQRYLMHMAGSLVKSSCSSYRHDSAECSSAAISAISWSIMILSVVVLFFRK